MKYHFYCLDTPGLLIFILLLCQSESNVRVKRDDGSFAQDFGGPVAQASGPEDCPAKDEQKTENITVTVSNSKGPKPDCRWKFAPKQILSLIDLSKENDNSPTNAAELEKMDLYNILSTEVCELSNCFKICRSNPSCNYILRSELTFKTRMIRVDVANLTESKFANSSDFDSFGLFCREIDKRKAAPPPPTNSSTQLPPTSLPLGFPSEIRNGTQGQPQGQVPQAIQGQLSEGIQGQPPPGLQGQLPQAIQGQLTKGQPPATAPRPPATAPLSFESHQQNSLPLPDNRDFNSRNRLHDQPENRIGGAQSSYPKENRIGTQASYPSENRAQPSYPTENRIGGAQSSYPKENRIGTQASYPSENRAQPSYPTENRIGGAQSSYPKENRIGTQASYPSENRAQPSYPTENRIGAQSSYYPAENKISAQVSYSSENKYGAPLSSGTYDKAPAIPEPPIDICIRLLSEPERRKKFNAFTTVYNKNYTEEQRHESYENFKDNLQIVQKLNCDVKYYENKAKFKINEFSDTYQEDFASKKLGGHYDVGRAHLSVDNIPEAAAFINNLGSSVISQCKKFSWQDQGVIPDVRNQQDCSSSFAFATADLLSAQYQIDHAIKDGKFLISPQYLIDCMTVPASSGCRGGRPIEVLRKLTDCVDQIGCNAPKEECYPFQGVQGTCQQKSCQEDPEIPVKWAANINATGKLEKEMIATILHYGPAIVGVDALRSWQFFSGNGVLHADQCGTNHPNHHVLLVGYDFTGPVPYYIAKNSWGKEWGDQGYIKLEAGKNACNLAESVIVICTRFCGTFQAIADLVKLRNTDSQCSTKLKPPFVAKPRKLLPAQQPSYGLQPSVQPSKPAYPELPTPPAYPVG